MIIPVSPAESLPPGSSDTLHHFSFHPSPATASGAAPLEIGTGIPPGINPANTTELKALIQTPLQFGKTLIIYHPHALQPPEIIDTAALSLRQNHYLLLQITSLGHHLHLIMTLNKLNSLSSTIAITK